MESNSESPEKLDALDLIIQALKDHEKRLDALSHRLESICKSLLVEGPEIARKEEKGIEPPRVRKAPLVICNIWSEFKDVSKAARVVAFEIEGISLHIHSMVGEDVFGYSEDLPDKKLKVVEEESCFSIDKASLKDIGLFQLLIERRLKCGLGILIKSSMTALPGKQFLFEFSYDLDPDGVKDFLSRELGVSKSNVVQGKITC